MSEKKIVKKSAPKKIVRKKPAPEVTPDVPVEDTPMALDPAFTIGVTEPAVAPMLVVSDTEQTTVTTTEGVDVLVDKAPTTTVATNQQCALVCFNPAGEEGIFVDFHGIKMEVFPCPTHLGELLTTASRESDRGLCHVCNIPIKETYWQHLSTDSKRCHGRCDCPDWQEGKERVYFNEPSGQDINSIAAGDGMETGNAMLGGLSAEPRIVR